MSRRRLWAGLILLFTTGVLAGILGTVLFVDSGRVHRGEGGPAAQHDRIMKRLTRELSLTDSQQHAINPIVTRAQVSILELRLAHQAEIEQIVVRAMTELKEKLSPAQQSGLDKMYARLQQRWQASRAYVDANKQGVAQP